MMWNRKSLVQDLLAQRLSRKRIHLSREVKFAKGMGTSFIKGGKGYRRGGLCFAFHMPYHFGIMGREIYLDIETGLFMFTFIITRVLKTK